MERTSDDLLPGSRPCPFERRLSSKPHFCPAIAAPQGDRREGGLRSGLQCSDLGPDSRAGGAAGGGGRKGKPQVLSHGSLWGVEPQPLLRWKREMWATRHLNSSGGSIPILHIYSQSPEFSKHLGWARHCRGQRESSPGRCWREWGQAEREGPPQVQRLRKVGRGRWGPRGACGTLSGPGSPGSTLGAGLLACRGAGSLSGWGGAGREEHAPHPWEPSAGSFPVSLSFISCLREVCFFFCFGRSKSSSVKTKLEFSKSQQLFWLSVCGLWFFLAQALAGDEGLRLGRRKPGVLLAEAWKRWGWPVPQMSERPSGCGVAGLEWGRLQPSAEHPPSRPFH